MAAFLALFFAALIAVSQAAPRPQNDGNSQQTTTNTGASVSGGATDSTANTGSTGATAGASVAPSGTTVPQGSVAIIIPSQLVSTFFPSVSASGTSTNGGSGGSANSPLAAIISVIPNVINTERERFGNAVETLVQNNAAAIGDMIDSAATTGGKLLSNGVRLVSAWPTFFGNLIG